jgi:hypothetical protein
MAVSGDPCDISKVQAELEKLLDAPAGTGVVIKCNGRLREAVVEDVISGTPQDFVEDAGLHGENRIVAYRCGWCLPQDPSGRVDPAQVLVWFRPGDDTHIEMTRLYYPTMQAILQRNDTVFKRAYTVTDPTFFDDAWFEKNGYTPSF